MKDLCSYSRGVKWNFNCLLKLLKASQSKNLKEAVIRWILHQEKWLHTILNSNVLPGHMRSQSQVYNYCLQQLSFQPMLWHRQSKEERLNFCNYRLSTDCVTLFQKMSLDQMMVVRQENGVIIPNHCLCHCIKMNDQVRVLDVPSWWLVGEFERQVEIQVFKIKGH